MLIKDPNFKKWIVSVRRHIHSHPELGYMENQTAEYVTKILKDFGLKLRTGLAKTGIVGLLGNGRLPVIAFRADFDALPIQEKDTAFNKEYKSQFDGVMHACGHDANTAIMLGLAKLLAENPSLLNEKNLSAMFLFQPAEEGGAGARRMIEDGALDNPKPRILLALHMYPELEIGNAGIYESQGYGYVDHFAVRFKGKGGHTSRPHQCRDPIMAACYFVTGLQTVVTRSVDPMDPALITVGKISGGEAPNVIPEVVELEGTIRALSGGNKDMVWKRIIGLADSVKQAFEVQCEPIFTEWYPPCINDSTLTHFLYEVCSEVMGKDKVHFLKPVLGAEDFAFYGPIVPSAIFRLGCSNREKGICWDKETNSIIGLHNPGFDIDEDVLTIGVSILVKALEYPDKLPYFK